MKGYCMRCKGEREMKGQKPVVMRNGRPATEGMCPDCGTRLYRLGRAKQGEAA